MQQQKIIAIFGGTGFIGHHLVAALAKQNYHIRIACRNIEKAMHLRPLANIGCITPMSCDYNNQDNIDKITEDCHGVINLVGVLHAHGGKNSKKGFDHIHHQFAKNIAQSAKKNNVEHYIHIAGLGIKQAAFASHYAKSKLLGEMATLKTHKNAISIRPSVVLGNGDDFVPRIAPLLRMLPVMPIFGDGDFKLQPIYVGDLVNMIVKLISLSPDEQKNIIPNRIINACGPQIYTFKEMLDIIADQVNVKARYIHLPMGLAKIIALFAEQSPKPFITRDQLRLMRFDSIHEVGDTSNIDALGITPQPIIGILPQYCDTWRVGGRFTSYRY